MLRLPPQKGGNRTDYPPIKRGNLSIVFQLPSPPPLLWEAPGGKVQSWGVHSLGGAIPGIMFGFVHLLLLFQMDALIAKLARDALSLPNRKGYDNVDRKHQASFILMFLNVFNLWISHLMCPSYGSHHNAHMAQSGAPSPLTRLNGRACAQYDPSS